MAQQQSLPTIEYIDLEAVATAEAVFSPAERDVLEQVNRKVAAAASLDAVMSFLFDATADICPCDRIGLAFTEDDNRRVTAYWSRARYEPLLLGKGYSEPLQGSSLEAVLQRRQVRVINDLEAYLADHPASRSTRLLVAEGVRSSMTCPLLVEDRTVGLMFRSSRRPRAYTAHHVQTHLAVSERLSQAVEKAYRIELLDQANRAYLEMLGFVSHELKNPLASIVMDAELLLQGYLGDVPPKVAEKIGRMVHKAEFLLNLVREYLDLARLEGGELEIHPRAGVDFVGAVVQTAVELLAPQIQQKQARVRVVGPDDGLPVQCDADLMRIVMVNLVGNAVKYGNDGGAIEVRVEHQDGRLQVSVWNEGPGFPAEQRRNLFRKFGRLQTPELLSRKGTGVGLYTTWRIIRLHGGVIEAESEPGQWARFKFDIPQPLPETVGQRRDLAGV